MPYKILCVDDDPTMLTTLRLTLRPSFEIETAEDAAAGLQAMKQKGPFAVILSDMKMPGMDGSTFLNEVNYLAPDAVRIMLTGNRDQETAMRAVNEGHVFQLVTKPCDLEMLVQTVHAAVRQYQLINSERELLEQTLSGSVKLLTDVLSMADPTGFIETTLLRDYIHNYLDLNGADNSSRWEIEVSAMLLNLGHVAVPHSLLEKENSGAALSDAEKEILERIPETGYGLLVNIPRLQQVAEIVRYQNKNYDGSGFFKDDLKGEDIPYGARIIKVLKDLIEKEASGLSRAAASALLRARKGIYDPKILENCSRLNQSLARTRSRASGYNLHCTIGEQACARFASGHQVWYCYRTQRNRSHQSRHRKSPQLQKRARLARTHPSKNANPMSLHLFFNPSCRQKVPSSSDTYATNSP